MNLYSVKTKKQTMFGRRKTSILTLFTTLLMVFVILTVLISVFWHRKPVSVKVGNLLVTYIYLVILSRALFRALQHQQLLWLRVTDLGRNCRGLIRCGCSVYQRL